MIQSVLQLSCICIFHAYLKLSSIYEHKKQSCVLKDRLTLYKPKLKMSYRQLQLRCMNLRQDHSRNTAETASNLLDLSERSR